MYKNSHFCQSIFSITEVFRGNIQVYLEWLLGYHIFVDILYIFVNGTTQAIFLALFEINILIRDPPRQAVETLISPFYPIPAVRRSLECHNVGGKICSRSRTLATCEQTSVSFAYTRIFFIFFSIRFIFKCIILFYTELYCSIVMRKCCMGQGT